MKTLKYLIIILLTNMLLACQSAPQKTEYVLDPRIIIMPAASSNSTIGVSIVQTSNPILDTKNIAYSQKVNEIEYYTKSAWMASPTKILQALFTKALNQSHYYRDVVELPSDVAMSQRLDLNIINMHQYFNDDGSNYVELELHVRLIDLSKEKTLLSQIYKEREIGMSYNVQSGIEAYDRVLSRLIPKIIHDLAKYR